MEAIFLRSLALSTTTDAACVTNASRTPADGTFAVASRTEGVIQVYAASCAALLHEFSTIHRRVHALHYTSFSDSLVTLESDRQPSTNSADTVDPSDEETFLCVYHDWRERSMVRGYTLPLGVLDTPSFRRKADCVAVCSYTGRVVVAMGSVLNIWQCSQGFFEHVMELKVDMTQQDAYHVLEFVAIHGVYVSFGSSTEVRVMEVHVSSTKDAATRVEIPSRSTSAPQASSAASQPPANTASFPEDDENCVHFDTRDDMSAFESIPIPLASYGETSDESDYLHLLEKSMYNSEQDESPVVLDRDEALQEELNLAGVIKQQDIRVNQALNYYVAENDVRIIMRRFLPPNQRIQTLKFLPETIDNHASLEARSYARLLVGTTEHAFLYYFLSSEADATRKKMAKKVLGKGAFVRQASASVARSSPTSAAFAPSDGKPFEESAESGRVVMHYAFASPVTCITANSSFLFATSASSLQVWSIWSPCHHLAATRTLNSAVQLEPTQPRLISVQPLHSVVSDIAALDSYVVLLPPALEAARFDSRDFIRITSAAAAELLPASELEIRRNDAKRKSTDDDREVSMMIFQQSPPSAIYSLVQSKQGLRSQTRVDLLLSLYSLYRYRADVGANALAAAKERVHTNATEDARETMIVQLETTLYDRLACDCAGALAAAFLGKEMRDLPRAVLFFEASKAAPSKVLRAFRELVDKAEANQDDVVQATHKYLEACVFDSGRVRSRILKTAANTGGSDVTFTRSVVSHYVQHAPERLPHLVTNSSLVWTLEDLHFGFETLKTVRVQDSSHLAIAQLVLILRGQSIDTGVWDVCLAKRPTVHSKLKAWCSPKALTTTVDGIIRSDRKVLLQLCVSRPDVLVRECEGGQASASPLSQALLGRSPDTFGIVLETVFESAVGRRESVFGTVLLCLKAIGDTIQPSITRISARSTTAHHEKGLYEFTTGHGILLRLLRFVLDSFPRLHALAEKDEISEDDDELLLMRRLLSMELVHVSVALVSATQAATLSSDVSRELLTISPESSLAPTDSQEIPEWELEYLDTRCLPPNPDAKLVTIIRHFLQRVLWLSNEAKLLKAQDILTVYESAPANDFGLLMVLLALPRKNRTVDGLRLLSERDEFVELFLPYAKSFCSTLAEWKFLIETLSTMSEETNQVRDSRLLTAAVPHAHDELGVLESVLNHVCSTLGPEDLLQVLPDDGDLALFMSTLEASVRVEAARATGGVAAH